MRVAAEAFSGIAGQYTESQGGRFFSLYQFVLENRTPFSIKTQNFSENCKVSFNSNSLPSLTHHPNLNLWSHTQTNEAHLILFKGAPGTSPSLLAVPPKHHPRPWHGMLPSAWNTLLQTPLPLSRLCLNTAFHGGLPWPPYFYRDSLPALVSSQNFSHNIHIAFTCLCPTPLHPSTIQNQEFCLFCPLGIL